MSLTLTAYPQAEPITLEEIKEHLNIDLDIDEYDSLLESMISAARSYCEKRLGRVIVRTSYNYSFDNFSGSQVELPKGPAISVESITYFDESSSPNTQTLSTDVYGLDAGVNPPVVYLKHEQSWPSTRGARNDVTISFTVGYADSIASPRDYDDLVPEEIKAAIKLIVGDLFLNRERKTDIQTYMNDAADIFLDMNRSWATN